MDSLIATMTLGRLNPSPHVISAAWRTLQGETTPENIFDTLSRSKVTRVALVSLEKEAGSDWVGQLRDLLADEVREDDRWRTDAVPTMRQVVSWVGELGGHIIKGLSVQTAYPEPGLRHVGDVDVHYGNWEAAQPLVQRLREHGWVFDTGEMPWLKWHENGALYGQLSLLYPDSSKPFARVDLHISAFSVGHAGLLPLIGWCAGGALGLPATVPDTETAIAITAAHALCDQMLSIKDLNDLHVLIARRATDWSSVAELCRAAQAGGALARLVNAVRMVYPEDAELLPPGPGAETALQLIPPSGDERAEAFAELAYRDELARGTAKEKARALAESARYYFSADLSVRSGVGPRDALPGAPARERCWRLVPEEVWRTLPAAPSAEAPAVVELASRLTLLSIPAGLAVRYGDDVLIPTVWGEISPESVALAGRTAE
jgi:Uncharacterised nucleotidyltransferase